MNAASGSSRILTLVFTDLVDSTALKTQRGDQVVGELIERHRVLVRRFAGESGGDIVDWAGDGCFLTFPASSAAVRFALRLQQAHSEEPDLPLVRTGLHMGEVTERPGGGGADAQPRVEGLAVDLAARICGLARPAQILMSSSVVDSARQRLDTAVFDRPIGWRAYGPYALKGIDEPVEIREVGFEGVAPFVAPPASEKATPARVPGSTLPWSRPRRIAVLAAVALGILIAAVLWLRATERTSAVETGAVSGVPAEAAGVRGFGDRPAIAVLPFDNLSPDPDQALFADGLAADLITRLSTWRAFPVIARNSSFQYRGGNLDLKRVSRELGARYLVEGSVRRAGDRIRVAAQLIDAATGEHVWAETFDRQVADVFELEDEISATIAASLVDDLNRAEAERARRRGTENLEAWSHYQLGMQHYHRQTAADYAKARGRFEQAVATDPRFASALAHLALANFWEVYLGWSDAPDEKVEAAFATARRAMLLDPREPIANVALGVGYLLTGAIENALDAIQRAVELNPSMPEAWAWLGWVQLLAGDPDAAIRSSEQARRLNPQGPSAAQAEDNMALAYFETERYQAGFEAARKLVAKRPEYVWGHVYVAINAAALGRIDEASEAIAEARRLQPDVSLAMLQRVFSVSRPEIDARRNAALRQAGLE